MITLLGCIVCTVMVAQNLMVPAWVVYLKEGTTDTIMARDMKSRSYVYGVDDPWDGAYITTRYGFGISYAHLYDGKYSFRFYTGEAQLTALGKEAPYERYGIIVSGSHITEAPPTETAISASYSPYYFVDDGQWHKSDDYLELIPGTVYYFRAYYVLDGKCYFSPEQETKLDRTMGNVYYTKYPDYTRTRNYLYTYNYDIAEEYPDVYTKPCTKVAYISLDNHVKAIMDKKTDEELTAMSDSMDVCDDGVLYIIRQLPKDVLDEAVTSLVSDAETPFYIQANLGNVYYANNNNDIIGTKSCTPTIMQCDESWGIRDNQYLVTPPSSMSAKPQLALSINHVMLPGKMYDITLKYALATDVSLNDSCSTYFYVYIGDGKGVDMPEDRYSTSLLDYEVFGNDTTIGSRTKLKCYEVKPGVKRDITMQYTPKTFSYCHVMQLNHAMNFVTAASRKKYCQQFRVIGIEVKPHEDK